MRSLDRRTYQREVARLLERIDAQTDRRRLLEAAGAQHGALAALEGETERTRLRLAALVAGRQAQRRVLQQQAA